MVMTGDREGKQKKSARYSRNTVSSFSLTQRLPSSPTPLQKEKERKRPARYLAYRTFDTPSVQAVRDHEYMGKYARTSNDPFIATSQRLYDKKFLEAAMTKNGYKMPEDFLPPPRQQYEQQLPQHEAPIPLIERLKKHSVPTGPWERDNTDKPARTLISTRTKAWKRAYWTRIGAALIGGTFLIAPMWILALQRNLFVHLSVATACIAAFGISISLYLETVDGVFAATLAYAAVIMVFVGIVIEETGSS